MVFVLDNYDSFTYNLVQYLGELGVDVVVRRNDQVTIEEVQNLNPERILLSPGPCTPEDAGITIDLVKNFAGKVPLLGVCLGHQAIGAAFGGKVIRAPHLMHGKTSEVRHDNKTIFHGLPSPMTATRYHSLIVEESSLPDELEVSAYTTERDGTKTIMGPSGKCAHQRGQETGRELPVDLNSSTEFCDSRSPAVPDAKTQRGFPALSPGDKDLKANRESIIASP
jgi:anthranilate synthase/aminodeoxychorismate synthase-like glutamine amidotransferase